MSRQGNPLRIILSLTLLLLAARVSLKAEWKIIIDKKPNQITGRRNAQAQVAAKFPGTGDLVLGCIDGKQILRVADRFAGFRIDDGDVPVKVRMSLATEFLEFQALVGRTTNGYSILFLDDKLPGLLPKMRTDPMLLIQIPYTYADKIVKFPMAGLDAALGKLAAAGCQL